jgi:hypothetical protein
MTLHYKEGLRLRHSSPGMARMPASHRLLAAGDYSANAAFRVRLRS